MVISGVGYDGSSDAGGAAASGAISGVVAVNANGERSRWCGNVYV